MAVVGWQIDPDFNTNRDLMVADYAANSAGRDDDGEFYHWMKPDISALHNGAAERNARRMFQNSPVPLNFMFIHGPKADYDPFLQYGEADQTFVGRVFGRPIQRRVAEWTRPDAINILLTNNKSDEMPISIRSAWMIAHRTAHAVIGGKKNFVFESHFKEYVKRLLSAGYGVSFHNENRQYGRIINDDIIEIMGKLLGHTLGTMKSARSGSFVTVYEWMYESFAQYLVQGNIVLRPLPDMLDVYPLTREPNRRKKVMQTWWKMAPAFEKHFAKAITNGYGKIWII